MRLLVWFIEVTCINNWGYYYELIGLLIRLNEVTHRLNDITSMNQLGYSYDENGVTHIIKWGYFCEQLGLLDQIRSSYD